MAEVLPLSETELRLLESLLRHKIRFMVVGLSAAALQGAPVVTEDIDLWFDNLSDPKLMQALVKVGTAYIPPFGYNPPMLGGAGSDLFDVVIRMDGLGKFADEWKLALEIKVGKLRLKVLPLERIVASKQAANRPKDQRVIAVLQNTLRTLQGKKKEQATPKKVKSEAQPSNQVRDLLLAMVALSKPALPDLAKLEKRFKEYPPTSDLTDFKREADIISFSNKAGGFGAIALMPVPLPWSDLEGPCATSWLWPEAAQELKKHTHHLIVTVAGGKSDIIAASLRLTAVVAALCSQPECIGVY